MKTTISQINAALIESRAALMNDIGAMFRERNTCLKSLSRERIRAKINAYRVVSNIYSGEVEFFDFSESRVTKLKKSLDRISKS